MTKATLLNADALGLLGDVPRSSPLVLDFGAAPFQAAPITHCTRERFQVVRLLAAAATLSDPRIEGFLGKGTPVLVRLERAPTIAEVLAHARRLAQPELQVELPLETDEHLDVLRILTSLGVSARIPVQALRTHPELVGEAMADAVARPGKRAPLSPFTDLERGFYDEHFELAVLDLVANDHHVDLRAAQVAPPETAWESPDVFAKRIPFLRKRGPCAFCEGLLYCHGHLFAPETFDTCRAFFSEFMVLFDGIHARGKDGGGSRGPSPAPRSGGGRPC